MKSMKQCIICNNNKNLFLYPGILKCPSCNHVFADSRFTDEELKELYSREYFFGEEYSNYLADQRVLEKNFQSRLKVLKSFCSFHSSLLEIGSAYGFFLNLARKDFQQTKGIDICTDGVQYAQKTFDLNVECREFLQLDFKEKTFDVICLWDTIEHLQAPQLYIEKIGQLAKKGSLIAITTGDVASFNAKFRGKKWRLIHPPTHLHYFSQNSMVKLLDNCGFEVIYNQYCGFYRSMNNIAYNLFVLRSDWNFLYAILKKMGLCCFDVYLNLFDIMYVIARKK